MNSGIASDGSSAFVAAVDWLTGLLAGKLALTIAVIAVASLGLMLISGRLDVRRSVRVILGCFIIFGASSIAAGIMNATAGTGEEVMAPAATPPPTYPAVPARTSSPTTPYDPYAGASVPPVRQ